MLTNQRSSRSLALAILLGLVGVGVCIVAGFLAGTSAKLVGLAIVAVGIVFYFFTKFEQAVLVLLILRSSLDVFSDLQIPAVFAIGLDALTLVYVIVSLLTGHIVRTDRFWWFLAGWVLLQGLWLILLHLGALGLDASYLPASIREWVRLFSWVMVYLLVMQLKDRLPPQKVIASLFLALLLPIAIGLLQICVPSLTASLFSGNAGADIGSLPSEAHDRIVGTFGTANTFATFLLLFISLVFWKLNWTQQRWFWLTLLGLLCFFLISTKTLFSLMMIAVFVLVLITPKLNLVKLISGVLFLGLVIVFFASTEFGQQRLASIAQTPLLNPDIDISRAILLSQGDSNSFNWRLSQWYLLLNAWKNSPIFGYGLGLSMPAAGNDFLPHNDYIRALVEGGIIGLVSFLALFAAQFTHLLLLIQQTPYGSQQRNLCFILLAMLTSIPVGMITENIWSHTTLFFYWWTLLAVAGWNWNEQQVREDMTFK
ncbi:O-antigen ligase family protein [Desmonostoc muscorum CCALA 125]|nr:O-antigen ligase family protein [Desmonostoc muscorum CCALA 125]